MCNTSGIIFGATSLNPEFVRGKRVLDVGALDFNGSLRSILKMYHPAEYIGTDIEEGPGVDTVCRGEDLIEKFGENSFDIVIATEVVEHTRNWREIFSNLKRVCKPGGTIIVTTRSKGFRYHAYPYDFWRYELSDMKRIFNDCEIMKLESDTLSPGVFVNVKKPLHFIENDLSELSLYSIVAAKRVRHISDKTINTFRQRYLRRQKIIKIAIKIAGKLLEPRR